MDVTYITRFSAIEGMRGYKVFECAINYMAVINLNTLSLIIPSGGNS